MLRSLIQETRQSAAKQEGPHLYASFFEAWIGTRALQMGVYAFLYELWREQQS